MSDEAAGRVADELERRGLAAPARLLVDAHRPLAPLLSDLGAAVRPILRGMRPLDEVATVLEDPAGLDRVISALDDRGEPRAGRR